MLRKSAPNVRVGNHKQQARARASMKESGSSADTLSLCGLQRSDSRKSLRLLAQSSQARLQIHSHNNNKAHPLGSGFFPENCKRWEMRSRPSTVDFLEKESLRLPYEPLTFVSERSTWICTPDLATSPPSLRQRTPTIRSKDFTSRSCLASPLSTTLPFCRQVQRQTSCARQLRTATSYLQLEEEEETGDT